MPKIAIIVLKIKCCQQTSTRYFSRQSIDTIPFLNCTVDTEIIVKQSLHVWQRQRKDDIPLLANSYEDIIAQIST